MVLKTLLTFLCDNHNRFGLKIKIVRCNKRDKSAEKYSTSADVECHICHISLSGKCLTIDQDTMSCRKVAETRRYLFEKSYKLKFANKREKKFLLHYRKKLLSKALIEI